MTHWKTTKLVNIIFFSRESIYVAAAAAVDAETMCAMLPILFLSILLMDETEGTLYLSQMPSERSLSRISQAKIPGSWKN